jgi:hypothetical protein
VEYEDGRTEANEMEMITEGQDVLFERDSDMFREIRLIVVPEAVLGGVCVR